MSQSNEFMNNIESNIDAHPFTVTDTNNYILPSEDSFLPTVCQQENWNVDQCGEVMNDDIEEPSQENDPILQNLIQSQQLMNKTWSPALNSIREENIYDIKIAENQPIVAQTQHVSNKRHRGRKAKDTKLRC